MLTERSRLQQAWSCHDRHSWKSSSSREGTSLWKGPSKQKSGGPGWIKVCPSTHATALSRQRKTAKVDMMFANALQNCVRQVALSRCIAHAHPKVSLRFAHTRQPRILLSYCACSILNKNHVAQQPSNRETTTHHGKLANTLTISALILIHGCSSRPQTSLQPVQIYHSGAEEERAETARLVSV